MIFLLTFAVVYLLHKLYNIATSFIIKTIELNAPAPKYKSWLFLDELKKDK